ncbi:TlpA family protein disulfide reductase [Flavobacterium aciduliphilum]|uniref:Peroxiredoxin n=1 Tax=Flavobacterium aciduliphilum TaxID=1101402 RepID=A0A328YH07_9FLAO|nr:TlpA disulfide reductase family protein [Flavobacterium aciduliphilum]RAR69967.1 peroxiredoxin [Flavobacterium aciduliphilum]
MNYLKLSLSIFFVFIFTNSVFCQLITHPDIDPILIQQNYIKWLDYNSENILLSRNFIPLNEESQQIEKKTFLELLTTSAYIPLVMQATDDKLYYKLYKIQPTADSSISATISQMAFEELTHLNMEGTVFPKFDSNDINGHHISNETFKDRFVIIKCWYIHCAACIREFPEVNDIVRKTTKRKDVFFLSLAEDTPEQLKMFLKKKPLLYEVVPNMKRYMNETLQLNSFPTHFIINKKGVIVKVVSDVKSLKEALIENKLL